MGGAWNPFRIAGDCSHLLSKCILMLAIHRNKSGEGVSHITQILYAIVFCARYTDLFQETSHWNLFFKIFYISTSFYIIAIMQWVYPRTREREISWKIGAVVLAGSLVLSPFAMLILEGKKSWSWFTWFWDFSQILESVCVLPQLVLLRQTSEPTVIDSFYLLALGMYRFLYVLNWIDRGLDANERPPNAVSVIFGVIQTLLYADFAWVYYTRQRVKLRNGGIIDADDIRRGWLLNRILGKHVDVDVDDEESAPALSGDHQSGRTARPKWGARGISVSADDDVLDTERSNTARAEELDGSVDPDAKMRDPDELAMALDDEDDESGAAPSSSHADASGAPSGIRNGQEWRDS